MNLPWNSLNSPCSETNRNHPLMASCTHCYNPKICCCMAYMNLQNIWISSDLKNLQEKSSSSYHRTSCSSLASIQIIVCLFLVCPSAFSQIQDLKVGS